MNKPVCFEVHPDGEDGWILYRTGDGGFDQIAVFADKGDANFARDMFECDYPKWLAVVNCLPLPVRTQILGTGPTLVPAA